MTRNDGRRGRIQFFLIALVFFGPLLLATWLYFAGTGFRPEGRSNHGELLQPIVNIEDTPAASSIEALDDGRWLLVYMNDGVCDEPCEFSLYTLRQSRLMLGREMERLLRVFLHGTTAPDRVFLADEHAGLATLRNDELADLLKKNKPADSATGGYFLIDPLGNLVMYFRADIDPADMVDDIKHLLKLSRIG